MNEKIWVEKIRTSVRSTYALLFAIFLTAENLCALMEGLISSEGSVLSFEILSLLMCIAVWVVYAAAGKSDYAGKGLRFVSGIIKVEFIINWIVAIICVLLGIAVFVFGDSVSVAANEVLAEFVPGASIGAVAEILVKFAGIACIVFAVLLVVYNYLHVYHEHEFAKSLRETVDTDTNCVCEQKDVMIWMIILAVVALIGLIIGIADKESPLSIIESVCNILKYLSVFKFVHDSFGNIEEAR